MFRSPHFFNDSRHIHETNLASLTSEEKDELESLKTTKHRYMISKIFTQSQTDRKVDKCAFKPLCSDFVWNVILSTLGKDNILMAM